MTASGCGIELNANFDSATSVMYHIPETCDITSVTLYCQTRCVCVWGGGGGGGGGRRLVCTLTHPLSQPVLKYQLCLTIYNILELAASSW